MQLVPALIRAFARLPLPLAHLIGAGAGGLFARVPNRHRRVTQRNVALCFPELSAKEQRALARRSLVETGKTVTETPAVWRAPRERLLGMVRAVSGQEWIDEAIARGRGILLIAPHLGSWELVNIYCSAHWPLTTLYRPLRYPALEATVQEGRQRLGARMVPTNTRGVRAVYEALSRNEMVAITPDQDPGGGGGIFAPFFGIAAHTMTLLPRLIAKSGATPLLAFAERLPLGAGFHLRFFAAPAEAAEPDPEKAVSALNAGVEQLIRMRPEQYQWSYKRFRRRPLGEAPLY